MTFTDCIFAFHTLSILCLFQLDISGNCPVLYTPLGSGKIQKSKEIMGCTGSHSYESVFQGVPYDSASVS